MYERVKPSAPPQRAVQTALNPPAPKTSPFGAAGLPHHFAHLASVERERPAQPIQRLKLPNGKDTHPLPAFGTYIRGLLNAHEYDSVEAITNYLADKGTALNAQEALDAMHAIDRQLDIALVSRGRNRSEMYAAMSTIREIEGQSIAEFAERRYGKKGLDGLDRLATLGKEFLPLAHDVGLMSGENLEKFIAWVKHEKRHGSPWEVLEAYRQQAPRVKAYRSLKIDPSELQETQDLPSAVLRQDQVPESTAALKDRPLADVVRNRMLPLTGKKPEDMLQSVSLNPNISAAVANTEGYVGKKPAAARVVRIPLTLSELDVIDPAAMTPKYQDELPESIRVTPPQGQHEDLPFSGQVESFVPLTIFQSEIGEREILDPTIPIPTARLDVAAEERQKRDEKTLQAIENGLFGGVPETVALAGYLKDPKQVNRVIEKVGSGEDMMGVLIDIFEMRKELVFLNEATILKAIAFREKVGSDKERAVLQESPEVAALAAKSRTVAPKQSGSKKQSVPSRKLSMSSSAPKPKSTSSSRDLREQIETRRAAAKGPTASVQTKK